MDTLTAIRSRRTVKQFDGTPISRAMLTTLIDAATFAPTHRLTQPWRFAVLEQPAIARLSAWFATRRDLIERPDPAKGQAKWEKLQATLPTLGALIMVGWTREANPVLDLEEHAAASAAVQNMLVAATALGLASFWSTNPLLSQPETWQWCGGDLAREGFLGAIWLGTASGPAPAMPPRKSIDDLARWL